LRRSSKPAQIARRTASCAGGVIAEQFGVEFHERYVGKLLKTLGCAHMSARPRYPAQDERIVEAFKNV
jgi:transposase